MEIDVTIIIPTYNRLWSLPRAIESCLKNSCKIEIIVIDDASTDGTSAWLKTQPNIVTIIQPYNLGQTWGINQAASIAKGRYIKKIDSDDFIPDGIIDKQLALADKENSDIIVSRSDLFYEETQEIHQCPPAGPWKDFMEIQLGTEYGSHINAMLFKKEIFQNIPHRPDYSFRDDRLVLLEMGLIEPKISYLETLGHYWVQHKTQMQANYADMQSVVANYQLYKLLKLITDQLVIKNKLTSNRAEAVSNNLWRVANRIATTHIKDACKVVEYIKEINPKFKIREEGFKGIILKYLGFKRYHILLKVFRVIKYGIQ
jgi:glycosyltransferase involved in cell wall biosynthesis